MAFAKNPEIEKILKAHFQGKDIEFLIKWKGLEDSHNCWITQETLFIIAPEQLSEYLKSKEIKKEQFFLEHCQMENNKIDKLSQTIKKIQKESLKHPQQIKKILLQDKFEEYDMCLVEQELSDGVIIRNIMETKIVQKLVPLQFIEFKSKMIAFLVKLKKGIDKNN